ncbi:MAG: CRTAC1 family protein, partial [Planctomycetota bacterium JB042]
VATDSTPNFLFENLGDGRFADRTLDSNAAYNADGRPEAGMGIAVGDVDGDTRPDLFVTNLDGETNTLYRNAGDLLFFDETRARGLALDSLVHVGFGTAFLDVELDGDLDLLVGNGHILDNVERLYEGSGAHYRQRALLFLNDGRGKFAELGDRLPAELAAPRVVRGLALADYDEDGDLDVVLVQNDAPAALLRNDAERAGHFLTLRVVDASGREVLHASAIAEAGDRRTARVSLPGASYCSSHDPRIVLSTTADRFDAIEVRWPTGERAVLRDVATDRFVTVRPDGTVEERVP